MYSEHGRNLSDIGGLVPLYYRQFVSSILPPCPGTTSTHSPPANPSSTTPSPPSSPQLDPTPLPSDFLCDLDERTLREVFVVDYGAHLASYLKKRMRKRADKKAKLVNATVTIPDRVFVGFLCGEFAVNGVEMEWKPCKYRQRIIKKYVAKLDAERKWSKTSVMRKLDFLLGDNWDTIGTRQSNRRTQ